jgi:hypothetical protein
MVFSPDFEKLVEKHMASITRGQFEKEVPEQKLETNCIPFTVLELMLKSKVEVDTIYHAIKRVGLSDKILHRRKKSKAAALTQFDLEPGKFRYIKKHFLEDINLYTFTIGQEKRNFYGKLFQLIIENHGLGKYNHQNLYWLYKKMLN